MANEGISTEQQVPFLDIVRFVRQLSHDLRNHLNAAELQSAFINEIADDAELKDEVRRLRSMLSEMGGSIQRLTSSLAEVKLTQMPYDAAAFIEDLRAKLASQFPEQSDEIEWHVRLDDSSLDIDPQLLQQAMLELFTNAFLHERGTAPITATAEIRDGNFHFAINEPKTSFTGTMEHWGRRPFLKLKHGHYGLGLLRVRSIIEAHRGRLDAHYDEPSSSLITTIVLPLDVAE